MTCQYERGHYDFCILHSDIESRYAVSRWPVPDEQILQDQPGRAIKVQV